MKDQIKIKDFSKESVEPLIKLDLNDLMKIVHQKNDTVAKFMFKWFIYKLIVSVSLDWLFFDLFNENK